MLVDEEFAAARGEAAASEAVSRRGVSRRDENRSRLECEGTV